MTPGIAIGFAGAWRLRVAFGLLVATLCTTTLVALGQGPAVAKAIWEDTGSPAEAAAGVYQISAGGPGNVWVAADGVPWRWDGASWLAHPVTVGGLHVEVFRISALADGTAWASGAVDDDQASLWTGRWTGSGWMTMNPPQITALETSGRVGVLGLEAVARDDVWLTYKKPRPAQEHVILHFDGTSWTPYPLRGPGCGLRQAERVRMAIRRGHPIVAGECRLRDPHSSFTFVWELVDGRWAQRGPAELHDDWFRAEALPGGGLVALDGLTPLRRAASGDWLRRAPDAPLDGDDGARGLTVDPTNGAMLTFGSASPVSPFAGRAALCTLGGSDWRCRTFGDMGISSVDVDPVSGTRWAAGRSRGAEVWRRVPQR